MAKQVKKILVDTVSLDNAIAIAVNENATADEVRAAYLIIKGVFNDLSTYYHNIRNRVEALSAGTQMSMEEIIMNTDGDCASVLTEEITHTSVDMVGIHKDAQAQVTASYSDPIYAQVFTPNVRAKKSEVIRLAQEGKLPNANQRVKTVTYQQTKLFDFVESNKVESNKD